MSPAPAPLSEWIEVFHSKPSMAHCYLLEKLPSGAFTTPSAANELVDASHIRPGFRVFRLPARRITFALTNGTSRNWEDNHGANYTIDAVAGRYVIEHGIRRVGDADGAECVQAALRTADNHVQIRFRADLWGACFCAYQAAGEAWTPAPGAQMRRLNDAHGAHGAKHFEIVVRARALQCAFNDGAQIWDSNLTRNYRIGHPGKYDVTDGKVVYRGPADQDMGNAVDAPAAAPGSGGGVVGGSGAAPARLGVAH